MSNNEELIAYCGLYCGECFSNEGKIADLSRDLRKELRRFRFEKTAESLSRMPFFKTFENYPQCYEVLGALVKLRCRKGCRNGGGNPTCAMKVCCSRKGYEGCWECEDFEDCKKMEFLKINHGDAHIKNMRKIKRKGKKEFLEGKTLWYSKIKDKK